VFSDRQPPPALFSVNLSPDSIWFHLAPANPLCTRFPKDPALFSATFHLIHSGSFWFHLPPAQNGLGGRGQVLSPGKYACRFTVRRVARGLGIASSHSREIFLRVFYQFRSKAMGHPPKHVSL
jgi:hypothetical protein